MNRRDLLAILPSLGALPFLGKEIIREDKKIIILEPKEIKVVQDIPDDFVFHQDRLKFLMVYDDQVIASASPFEMGMSDGMLEGMETTLWNDMHYIRPPKLEVRATFSHDKVIKAVMNARRTERNKDIKL